MKRSSGKSNCGVIITCEHASSAVPAAYMKLFRGNKGILKTHRAFDEGALDLAVQLSDAAASDCFSGKTSRLLVDLNRSYNHPFLFSEFTKKISESEKKEIINEYYFPYRIAVEERVKKCISEKKGTGPVLHISVHSFVPVLNGVERTADIGLLYDPASGDEKQYSALFAKKLKEEYPRLKVRKNYPYRGVSDGFTSYLRKKYKKRYAGIELEINQKYVKNGKFSQPLSDAVVKTLLFLTEPD